MLESCEEIDGTYLVEHIELRWKRKSEMESVVEQAQTNTSFIFT